MTSSKRIIGVLTVKDGRLVKSYGYSAWRPAGDLVTALRNLDRWAADEVVVLDVSRRAALNEAVLRQIAEARIATPVAYGGGIRTATDVSRLMEVGCDRFVVESVLFNDPEMLLRVADLVGQQALIGSVPLEEVDGRWGLWRSCVEGGSGRFCDLMDLGAYLVQQPVSEFFITSVASEGHSGRFPLLLLDSLRALPPASAIWFGGLDVASAIACLGAATSSAVAFGNILYETELALPELRRMLIRSLPADRIRCVRKLAT